MLEKVLTADFVAHLPPLLNASKPADQQARKNLSRAFAAFAISKLCEIPPKSAAAAVVDDFDDYGKRTGVTAVDRLDIVAHDRFQEIVDEAKKPDSAIRLQQVILSNEQLQQKTVTVVSQPQLASKLGLQSDGAAPSAASGFHEAQSVFNADEQKIAKIAYDVIRKFETQPSRLPTVGHLRRPEVQAALLREVESQYRPAQLELDGIATQPDLAAIVAKTAEIVVQQTIDIPRILVVPKGEVKSGFRPFTLDLARMRYEAPNETLWAAHLRTGQIDRIGVGAGTIDEQRLEDYVVSGLIDFDDVAYDEHADLLYDLAEQVSRPPV
jgi:type III restriction enzyme